MRTDVTVMRMSEPVTAGERDRHVDHRAGDPPVGERGQGDVRRVDAGADGDRRGHRVLAVGDDLEVEVVEGDGLRQVVLQPLAGLVGGAEPGLPEGRRVAVEGLDRPGPQIAGEAALGVRHDAGVVGTGPADQAVDLVVGDQG